MTEKTKYVTITLTKQTLLELVKQQKESGASTIKFPYPESEILRKREIKMINAIAKDKLKAKLKKEDDVQEMYDMIMGHHICPVCGSTHITEHEKHGYHIGIKCECRDCGYSQSNMWW